MSDQDITFSEDRLRAILAEFKLDLIERLTRELSHKADLATVAALEKRIDLQDVKIEGVNAWKNKILGAIAVVAICIPVATALIVQQLQ